jgi:hypothetical protein
VGQEKEMATVAKCRCNRPFPIQLSLEEAVQSSFALEARLNKAQEKFSCPLAKVSEDKKVSELWVVMGEAVSPFQQETQRTTVEIPSLCCLGHRIQVFLVPFMSQRSQELLAPGYSLYVQVTETKIQGCCDFPLELAKQRLALYLLLLVKAQNR